MSQESNPIIEDADPSTISISRWNRPAGYKEVLRVAGPLVLSSASLSLQHFVDRMFLCWYSPETMAAAMPAGFLSFTLISFFLGTSSYANTFVAQYTGAERPKRVGPSVWQAIHFSLATGLLLPCLIPLAPGFFAWAGHAPSVQALENTYFRILLMGAIFPIYCNALSSFFTGLGRTWPVMWVNIGITAINLILDYALIFGHWGLPRMGIAGAAWATNIANASGAVAFTLLLFTRKNEADYAIRTGWRVDRDLFRRLMRYGTPNGLQFMLDMTAFTFFIFLVGRIGTSELAATNVAFQINTVAFLPMIGFGIATATLVGQYLGSERPALAARATWSAFHLTFAYMSVISILYVSIPALFIDPFAARVDAGDFAEVRRMATLMLYFVAAYSVFDTMNIIFASALKGAGDTRFVMIWSVVLGWSIMVLPTWWLCDRGSGGVFTAWTLMSLFVVVLGFFFLVRFLRGKWRTMRVIEQGAHMAAPPANLPAVPTSEVDL